MVWTLAILVGLMAQQPMYRPRQFRTIRPAIVQPKPAVVVSGNGFVNGQKPARQCSVPLVNAPGIRVKGQSMPMVHPPQIDPKMNVPPPAPPCENWFKR